MPVFASIEKAFSAGNSFFEYNSTSLLTFRIQQSVLHVVVAPFTPGFKLNKNGSLQIHLNIVLILLKNN
jgi:hypothetical protein